MPREALTQHPLFFVPGLRGLGVRMLTSPGGRGDVRRNFCSVIGSHTHSPPEGESKRSFSVSVGGGNRRKSPHGTCRVTLASSRSPSGGEQKQEGRAGNFAHCDQGGKNTSPTGRGRHAEAQAKAGG